MSDEDGCSPTEVKLTRGRTRICKSCKFTCTDSKEFLYHQQYAHSQEKDPDLLASLGNRRKSQSSLPVKRILTRSSSMSDVSSQIILNDRPVSKKDIDRTVQSHTKITLTKQGRKSDKHYSVKSFVVDTEAESSTVTSDQINDEYRTNDLNSNPNSCDGFESDMEEMENEQSYILNPEGEEQEEEGRLIIAEEEMPKSLQQPTRSGNIQNRTYVCNQCEFSSTSAKIFLHHQKDEHKLDITIYECDICEYATKYKQKLPRHRKLHFTGRENSMLSGSDLDSSFGDKSFSQLEEREKELMEHAEISMMEEEEEEEGDEEEEEEDLVTVIPTAVDVAEAIPGEKKKRKTRQEVDPAKYFEVLDEAGIKYACSKCGNVYKWRKSLNKHWKEKHFGDAPDLSRPPPGLNKLNTINHVKYRMTSGSDSRLSVSPSSGNYKGNRSATATPQSMRSYTPQGDSQDDNINVPSSHVVMPKFIGPFITNTMVYPANGPAPMGRPDAIHRSQSDGKNPNGAGRNKNESQPLDFSVGRKDLDMNKNIRYSKDEQRGKVVVKNEPHWNQYSETNGNDSERMDNVPVDLKLDPNSSNPILQCSSCGFIAKTLVDYSSHMTLHLNKRAFKCAECQEHFNGVEELNKHFLDLHSEKIHEHKEAIQKIPHGLQQTYHLLKMPLNAIGSMSTQEIGNGEPKYLKCSMCNFVAKWPAELQKHAVSHSEERPFVCMVCGSTYKWKWDLVKHFEKSHNTLPNPYKRREQGSLSTPTVQNNKNNLVDRNSPSPAPEYEISSGHIMSSTAAALLDVGSHNIRKIPYGGNHMEDPPKKKRRLSDTDLGMLDADFEKENENNGSYILAGALDGSTPGRPSSEPSASQENYKRYLNNGENLSMNSTSALQDMKKLIPSDDDEMQSVLEKYGIEDDGQITQDTHKAIVNAVKRKMDSEKNLMSKSLVQDPKAGNDVLLPYKCSMCEYRARWPSEITQHMKNHSDEKPYHCPRCSYKSKWKWDVVKHLKRCGGGTIKDVIDTNKMRKMPPPNVTVMPQGMFHQQTPQPYEDHGRLNGKSYENKDINMNFSYQDYEEYDDESSEEGESRQKQPLFRSLINQGLYHCLECPFVGHSPAELKRHAVLHSENKPFTCTICGYSSRWKCDLKKHMKTYGHYDPLAAAKQKLSNSNYNSPMYLQDKFKLKNDATDMSLLEQDPDRTLFQCDSCPYVTYKKSSFEAHVKIHGENKKEEGNSSKFKCKQCDFQGEDLLSFIQHKKTHTNGPSTVQTSPPTLDASSDQVSNRTLQKHRRKPVQQFKCSKCPYTCFKRSGLELHEGMHKPRSDAFVCFYCDYNVYSKSLLMQHMRLHPEFDARECQDLLNDEDGDMNSIDDYENMEDGKEEDDFMVIDDAEENEAKVKDREKAINEENLQKHYAAGYAHAMSQNLSQNNKGLDLSAGALDLSKDASASTPQSSSVFGRSSNRFPCEWCSGMFPNLIAVLKHAQAVHPIELKKQEMGDTSMSLPTQAPAQSTNADILKSKLIQQAQDMYAAQQQQAKMNQHLSHQRQQSPDQTVTFRSKLFDQSFTQHPRFRPIEPKPQSQLKSSLNTPTSTPSSSSMSLSMIQKLQDMSAASKLPVSSNTPTSAGKTQSQLAGQLILQQLKAKKTTSPHKRGRSFQCTKCSFTAPNAVTYLRHIERHGSNCRHTCRFCDYSIDRLNLLYQHMKGTHGDLWRGTPEEKINLTSNNASKSHEEKLMKMSYAHENVSDMNGSYDAGMYSENNSMHEESLDFSRGGEDSLNSSSSSDFRTMMGSFRDDNDKAAMVLKEATTWRGIPVQVCTINGRKNYKCPKCSYVSSNAANTTNHVRQHGSNRKYRCDKCDYSVDNLKLIYHHMESVHPKDSSGDKKLPFTVEMEYFPEENNNSLVWDEESMSGMGTNGEYESCTKCPFKCKSIEVMQKHFEMHDYKGSTQCNYCDYSVDSQKQLVQHLVVHREPYEPEEEEDGNEEEQEETMSMYTESRDNDKQDNNMEVMQNNESLIQSTAGGVKLTAQSLKNVMNRMKKNGERLRYRCATCPYFSFCKNNIVKHRKQHLIRNQYVCKMCDYSATRAYLLQQHMKFHEQLDDSQTKGTFQDIVLDPYDKEGYELLRNVETTEKTEERLKENGDEEKDFSDEASEQLENANSNEEFDEDEMAELEKAEFEGFGNGKDKEIVEDGHELENMSNMSDDSLSEMDPTALQQQITLNMSGNLSVPGEKIRYTCSLCPYKCNALRSFKCHIHMHGLNKKYICDHCNWSADRLNLLYQHRKVHIRETGFVLSPEDIVFLNRDFALENDGKKVSENSFEINNQPLKKSYDGVTEYDKMDASDSRRMSHKGQSTKKIYGCKLCPFSCNNKNSFAYHKNLHRITARYTCSECSYSVDRWNLLTQHLRLHQQDGLKSLRNRLRCIKCPFVSPTPVLLEAHAKYHGSGKEFVCKFCDFSMEKHNLVLQHQRVHLTDDCPSPSTGVNDMKNFEPSSPDIVAPQLYFSSPDNQGEDSLDDSVEKPKDLKCDRCPYGTPSKDELKDHEHQHNTHQKLSCPYCDFSCSKQTDLVGHVQLHLPSTKVTLDLINSLLDKQSKSGDKIPETPEVAVITSSKPEEQPEEPDSTISSSSSVQSKEETKAKHEAGEPILDVKQALKTLKEKEPKTRTKVYVCQYCEREFEGKNLMLQHERQHLIGSQY